MLVDKFFGARAREAGIGAVWVETMPCCNILDHGGVCLVVEEDLPNMLGYEANGGRS